MRENRLYGSEGGETGYSTGLSYPYLWTIFLQPRGVGFVFRRAAGESFPWAMLPASELKLAASATAGKFSSADRLTPAVAARAFSQ